MNIQDLLSAIPFNMTLISNICTAIIILIAGWIVAGFFRQKIRRSSLAEKTLNDTIRPVFASLVYYFILLTALYAALVKIGVTPTTLLAAFGAAGLAIALALKDTLANIAAGVMLLFIKSLQVGDYVAMPDNAGTIDEIGLFTTTLRNSEGIAVYIPNNIIWSNRVQNYNRHGERKAIIDLIVSNETDLQSAKTLLEKLLANFDGVKQQPSPPEVYVTDFTDMGIKISCRLWLPTDGWSARTSDLRIQIKTALDTAGIKMAVRHINPS